VWSVEDGPGLALLDDQGRARAGLVVVKDGPGFILKNETGKVVWSAP
jgi:hypothetical protein